MPGCRHKPSHIQRLLIAFDDIHLDIHQKKAIMARLESLLQEYSDRTGRYSCSFHTLRVVITVGSLIVPALLSVQYNTSTTSAKDMDTVVYWIVWMLSLFVTISNGVVTLFKVDKKYYTLNTTFQHILSEGWQYVELSGKYSGYKTPNLTPTHSNQYTIFATTLEKIRMKNIEDEYYKVNDSHTTAHPPSTNQQTNDTLIPPSIKQPMFMNSIPKQNSLLSINGYSEERKTTLRRTNETEETNLVETDTIGAPIRTSGASAPLLPIEESSDGGRMDE